MIRAGFYVASTILCLIAAGCRAQEEIVLRTPTTISEGGGSIQFAPPLKRTRKAMEILVRLEETWSLPADADGHSIRLAEGQTVRIDLECTDEDGTQYPVAFREAIRDGQQYLQVYLPESFTRSDRLTELHIDTNHELTILEVRCINFTPL